MHCMIHKIGDRRLSCLEPPRSGTCCPNDPVSFDPMHQKTVCVHQGG
jgi:hypothetical protein